jgi:hypothetical protein
MGSSHHTGANRQDGKTRAACRRKRRLPPQAPPAANVSRAKKGRAVCQ